MTHRRLHVGMRTVKSAVAVTVALLIVEQYGATAGKMIFALIGALSAMEPTFKGSVRNCLTQICGVVFGAIFGVLVSRLPIEAMWVIGLGVVLIITAYNFLNLTLSPALPCIILVTVCANPDIAPVAYALGRIWDTAIGLGVGLAINMLIFPYNNSRQIRTALRGLDGDLMLFLEDFFDGDEELPDTARMNRRIADIDRQLHLHRRRPAPALAQTAAGGAEPPPALRRDGQRPGGGAHRPQPPALAGPPQRRDQAAIGQQRRGGAGRPHSHRPQPGGHRDQLPRGPCAGPAPKAAGEPEAAVAPYTSPSITASVRSSAQVTLGAT